VKIGEAELMRGLRPDKLYRIKFSNEGARLYRIKAGTKPRKDMYFGFISVGTFFFWEEGGISYGTE
jgi:hypothetical protein